MMRFTIHNLLWLVLVVGSIAGCSRKVKAPDQLTLYSIDIQEDFAETGHGRFHGFPVFGKIEVKSATDREKIATALTDGISKSDKDGLLPSCFWPRHAISMVVNGQTIDYVICFQCVQIQVYSNGQKRLERTTKDAKQLFNDYLTAAGIRLAPEPKAE